MSGQWTCRSCGRAGGELALDLGMQPLANNFLRAEDLGAPEPKFALRVFVCPACWLLQITDLIPPVRLFGDYLYYSSFSETMLAHARAAAHRYIAEFGLGAASQVVEIASNDGYLLEHFKNAGVPCLGIEPALNVAAVAREKGIETWVEFFGAATGEKLGRSQRSADLILGNNVFAHVPEINDFVEGLRRGVKPCGRIILEFPHALELLQKNEFDTIYHEHVYYFNLTALSPLFERHGLEIFHVERLAIHGGSLRLFAGIAGVYPTRSSVGEILNLERRAGIQSIEIYRDFARRAEQVRDDLKKLTTDLQRRGERIAAYGAAAKGSTLLNFCGLNRESIEFVVDRSPYKQGRFVPGAHIPVLPPEQLLKKMPPFTLLLSWNFADEILEQQKSYRDRGGRFIIPIPQVRVV